MRNNAKEFCHRRDGRYVHLDGADHRVPNPGDVEQPRISGKHKILANNLSSLLDLRNRWFSSDAELVDAGNRIDLWRTQRIDPDHASRLRNVTDCCERDDWFVNLC